LNYEIDDLKKQLIEALKELNDKEKELKNALASSGGDQSVG